MHQRIRTSISVLTRGDFWMWCGDSGLKATDDNPHDGNRTDLPAEVYEALELAWFDREDDIVEVEVNGEHYRMTAVRLPGRFW